MPKNVTRTVRLDDDLDRALQDRARDANVSVNFLVNKLIRKFIDWDVPAERVGTVHVPSILIKRLYEEIDDGEAESLGVWIGHEFYQPFCKYLFGELTFETSIVAFKRMSEYGGRFVFDSSSDKKNHILVLRHGAGQKLSAYYAGLLRGVYEELLKMEVKVECTRDLCIAQIPVSRADTH
jgi:hypothetical protein